MAGPKEINSALSGKTAGGLAKRRGRPRHEDRPYVEARLWLLRTGCPWRDLPARFPQWRSVYTRWRRWVRAKRWARVLAALAADHDPETYAVDATYVRVHADGTRARGGYAAQAVGRSRGGLTSKIHLLTDALGNPVRFVCDRGYDADWWCERLRAAGHVPVVPGRRSRLVQPAYDDPLYRARHLVENCFARLKSARRLATRYEQTVPSYAAFVSLACSLLWLR